MLFFPYGPLDMHKSASIPNEELFAFIQHWAHLSPSMLSVVIESKFYWEDGKFHFIEHWQCEVLDTLFANKTGWSALRLNVDRAIR